MLRTHVFVGFLILAGTTVARAETYEVSPGDDLFSVWEELGPGDEVIVHGGTYVVGGYHTQHWVGTEDAPVVVRAAEGETPVIQGDPSQNAMNLSGEYFVFRGFEIAGGSHGLRLGSTHHALIEDLHVHDTDDVAVSANRDGEEYHHITFRRLHLHDTGGSGEGMYLGCNYGRCLFHDNLIEDSWIHDTNHGVAQGDGIEIKYGSYGNVVRNNVIYNTQYPCIIVYGTEGQAPNVIENNVLWNCEDSGIQAAADAVIRNNLIFQSGNGLNSHEHQGAVPSRLTIVNNTIVACDVGLRANGWAGGQDIVVANNGIYSDGATAVRIVSGGSDFVFTNNVVVGQVSGVAAGYVNGRSADQDLEDPANLDAWPTQDSPLIDAGSADWAPSVDYNWNPRDESPDVGAYEWQAGGNPGWQPGPGWRTDLDGGVPDAGPGPDALAQDGSPGDALASQDGAVSRPDAAVDASGDTGSGESGCGCRAASSSAGLSFLLGFLAIFLLRRRSVRRRADS